jgi:hypothetical protein
LDSSPALLGPVVSFDAIKKQVVQAKNGRGRISTFHFLHLVQKVKSKNRLRPRPSLKVETGGTAPISSAAALRFLESNPKLAGVPSI